MELLPMGTFGTSLAIILAGVLSFVYGTLKGGDWHISRTGITYHKRAPPKAPETTTAPTKAAGSAKAKGPPKAMAAAQAAPAPTPKAEPKVATSVATSAAPSVISKKDEAVALSKKEKRAFKLIEKRELSSDVRLFRFALPTPEHTLGLPTGKHMFLYAKVNGEMVMRAYTPTSNNNQKGYFDLVIKVYFANVHPRFPDGGKMSQHFESLKVGDTMEAKGPTGHIEYNGRGNFKIGKIEHQVDQVGFICGGTGITPAYQIMQTALRDDDDKTCFHLVLANQTESDILLREEMDSWATKYPARIKIWYTLDRPPADGWKYSTGFINDEMLKAHMPPPKDGAGTKSLVLMCGPPPMIKFACMPNLEKLGFVEDQLHCF